VHEHAPDQVLAVVGVDVLGSAVANTVEPADLIGEEAVRELALEHRAEVAARDEQRGERALDEHRRGRGLQALQPDRRLELSRLHLELREVAEVHVGVVERQRAVREVGHHAEVDVFEDRALDERTDAAKHERVVARVVAAREPARVELRVAAQLDLELPVRDRRKKPSGPAPAVAVRLAFCCASSSCTSSFTCRS
jgi:hypothetical protein